MEKTLSITKAEKKDAAAITQLINDAYMADAASPGWTSEGHYMEGQRTVAADIERLLDKPDTDNFKYGTADGEIVGFVSLEKHEQFIYLGLLTVSPHLQAGGIGRRLLEFAEAYAVSNHIPAISITVVNIRHELIAWYERRGYHLTGKTIAFPKGHNRPKVPVHLAEMKKEISMT
jgi:GNAT superfamily N-acetyltransferase